MAGFVLPSLSPEAEDGGFSFPGLSASDVGFCLPGDPAADNGFSLPAPGSESESSSTCPNAESTSTRQRSPNVLASSSNTGFLLPTDNAYESNTGSVKIELTVEVLAVLQRVFTNVRNLPAQAKKLLAASFTTSLGRRANVFRAACAGLLGVTEHHFRKMYMRVDAHFNQKVSTPSGVLEAGGADPREDAGGDRTGGERVDPEKLERVALENLVRTALASSVEGMSGAHFKRCLLRIQLAGGILGDKLNTIDFLKDVEYLGSVCVRSALGAELRECLPGLGIPSKFALIADGVNMSGGLFSTSETLLIIGIRFVCAKSGKIVTRLAACPSQGLCKDGDSTSALIKDALTESPLDIRSQRLRASLVAVGGDGQLTAGGPQAKHSSTKAAEILWKSVHPASTLVAAYWDSFHRGETAMRWSSRHPMAMEIFDVYKGMNAMFAVPPNTHPPPQGQFQRHLRSLRRMW